MKPDENDRVVLRQFLLGECTEEERERVEERLMADDSYFEEFQLVKEEVIDQYAEDEMTRDERERFERHFLTTPDRRFHLRLAQNLSNYDWSLSEKKDSPKSQPEPVGFSWFRTLFATPLRSAAAIAVVIAVAVIGWAVFFRASSTGLAEGLEALGDAYREQRPIEARVSDFQYAPWPNVRSGDEIKFDRTARARAEVLLQFAAGKNPDSPSHHALGKLYLMDRKFDDAIRHLEEALKTDGNNAQVHSDLGAAWLQRGELQLEKGDEAGSFESFGKSRHHLDRALEINPSLLEALFNRALVREQLKLFQLAEEDWKKYLEKDSTSPWADEARQKIKKLQERSKGTTQSDEQVFQSFLVARQNGNDQTVWKLLTQSRSVKGSFIENRLLDEYLAAATSGQTDAAREKLRLLTEVAALGVRFANEHFLSDLVKFYETAPRHKQLVLIKARSLLRSAHENLTADRPPDAINAYNSARKIFEENGDICDALHSRYGAAHAHLSDGQSLQSLNEFEHVRQEAEAKQYRWFEGQTLNALANVHIGLNNYSRALELSQQSLKILEDLGDIVGIVKVNDQLGTEYLRLGNAREALRFHHRALAIATENSFEPGPLWRSYFHAAVPFHALGLVTAGIDFAEESLRFAKIKNQHLNISRSYAQLGLMDGTRGNYDVAKSYFERAIDSAKQLTTERIRINALGYASLQMGNLYKQTKEFGRATESYDEAIRLFEQLDFKAFSYVAHKGKFLACVAQQGACPSVEHELNTALSLYESHRSKILETKNRYSFFDTEQSVYDVAIDYEFTFKDNKEKAFDYSERCRARSLLDPAGTNDQKQQTHHSAGDLRSAEPDELWAIQRAMPERTQIVQYAVLADKLLIWFVSPNKFEGFSQQISAKELEEKVVNYMSLVERRSDKDDELRQRAEAELFDLLIKPVAHHLEKNKVICLVPDKILNRLSFASLFSTAQGRYLIEEYALTFSPSSTLFARQSKAAAERGAAGPEKLLSVGDPSFDQKAFPNYRRLPSAGVEARAIAKMYQPREILLTDADATKDRVMRALKQADVIHLATHGVVDQVSPMYSKLLLAKSSTDNGDSALLAGEIYQLDLRARLVVLPACRTGVEQYYGGEGMVGIWSPFMTRNVPLVVASLWAVDSDSTKELMINFHKLRRSGLASAHALRQAQLEMLHGGNKSFQHPYHWASFIPIGGYSQF